MTSRSCTSGGDTSLDGRLYSGEADEKVEVWDALPGSRCAPCRDIRGWGRRCRSWRVACQRGGDGAVRVWEKVLTRKGRDEL